MFNKPIASELNISGKTVKFITRKISVKLGEKSVPEIIPIVD
jgi:FixJ family two-component response regulator